ncbi:MAG: DUF4214 domain-containing protein [Actinomycetota bacterium]
MRSGSLPPQPGPSQATAWVLAGAFVVASLLVLGVVFALIAGSSLRIGAVEDRQGVAAATANAGRFGSGDDTNPAGPAGPSTADDAAESMRCPVMTDSIDRIHLALFEEPADDATFARAVNRYRTGELTLEDLAQELVDSDRFARRWEDPDDDAFIRLVYDNALRRTDGLDDELAFWSAALGSGQSRGSLVVALTESERAVTLSRTTPPMAGYLRTYPAGTHWYCGVGPVNDLPIEPLLDTTLYADHMFHNGGSIAARAGLRTVVGSESYLEMASATLPPGVTSYRWNGMFDGDGGYGSALDVEAGRDTWWVVVFYPTSIGDGRLGWQIDS